jgi:hypothetical protein
VSSASDFPAPATTNHPEPLSAAAVVVCSTSDFPAPATKNHLEPLSAAEVAVSSASDFQMGMGSPGDAQKFQANGQMGMGSPEEDEFSWADRFRFVDVEVGGGAKEDHLEGLLRARLVKYAVYILENGWEAAASTDGGGHEAALKQLLMNTGECCTPMAGGAWILAFDDYIDNLFESSIELDDPLTGETLKPAVAIYLKGLAERDMRICKKQFSDCVCRWADKAFQIDCNQDDYHFVLANSCDDTPPEELYNRIFPKGRHRLLPEFPCG